MITRYHKHLVINFSIVMDENVNKIGHEDPLLAEVSRKGGDAGGITSLLIGTGRVCCLVEALSRPKINSEWAHEVGCSADSAIRPIN